MEHTVEELTLLLMEKLDVKNKFDEGYDEFKVCVLTYEITFKKNALTLLPTPWEKRPKNGKGGE